MTTIACNKSMMAGDRQFTHSGGMKLLGTTKIYELPEHTCKEVFGCKKAFVGFCGNADNFPTAIAWLLTPDGPPPKVKGVEMLMLTDKGHIYHATTLLNWTRFHNKHLAMGSGMNYAQAAMDAGKDPYEAVKIASKNDPNTGMKFNKLIM